MSGRLPWEVQSSDPMSEFNILPVAINIVVNSDRFGEMNRVYDLASYLEQKSMPGAAGAGGSGSGAGGTGSDTSDSGVDDESVEGESEELSR